MARKRMIAPQVVRQKKFLEMSLECQALYMQLQLDADDEGFVEPFATERMVGASVDALKLLTVKGFLVRLNEDVYRISHWEVMNYLRPDRFAPSMYQNLKQTDGYLALKEADLVARSEELYQRYTRSHTIGIPKERGRKKDSLLAAPKNHEEGENGAKPNEGDEASKERIEKVKEEIRNIVKNKQINNQNSDSPGAPKTEPILNVPAENVISFETNTQNA